MVNVEKKSGGPVIKNTVKVILGLILLACGAWVVWIWKADAWTVIKGLLGMTIILSGVIFLAIAKE